MIPPIPPPVPAPALRRPELALPRRRYLPGHGPHPFRHPDGERYTDGSAPVEAPWAVEDWTRDPRWEHGLDLFDHRYYWECHEALEALWHFIPRPHPVADLAQGLIQAAASALKRHVGEHRAAARLHERACLRLSSTRQQLGPEVMGLDLPGTLQALHEAARSGGYPLLARPQPPIC